MHKHTKSLTSEEGRIVWPFPSVNGVQTGASKALMAMPAPKKLSPYQQAINDPDIEECLL